MREPVFKFLCIERSELESFFWNRLAADDFNRGLGDFELFGEECNERCVGFSVYGRCRDLNFKSIVGLPADDFIFLRAGDEFYIEIYHLSLRGAQQCHPGNKNCHCERGRLSSRTFALRIPG